MTPRHPADANAILALFAERGAEITDVPVIQPADPFLDMAGEDLRRRIFLTESETGEQLCLRPEFTIPVCLQHIASKAGTPHRYAYLGEVFRQRREAGSEFFQCGIEDLGETNRDAADARSLADANALLQALLPGKPLVTTLGDQAVFEAVLAALGLPRGWQKRLARAFGSPAMLDAALADLAGGGGPFASVPHLDEHVRAGDRVALAGAIAADLEKAGIAPGAGRSPDEIANRLIEKADLAAVILSANAMAALKTFLAIRAPLDRAAATLQQFAEEGGIGISRALDAFRARAAAIADAGLGADTVVYDAAFGRPLDYYTGLVFETGVTGAARPLVGGGRYDRLLTLLGARTPIPGVGFSVWLDRVEEARGGAA